MKAFDQLVGWEPSKKAAAVVDAQGKISTVGPGTHHFHLASVTKVLFAYTILIAVEEESLPLNQPVGGHKITVAHLLSHSSGLAPERPVDPQKPTTLATPGSRRIYSNFGFELLGLALEDSTGMSAAEYLGEAIAAPLGMIDTKLDGSPAHGAHSTIEDMTRFVVELLNPTLISQQTLKRATTAFLPDISGVLPGYGRQDPNPWGLGFEIRGDKSPHWTGLHHPPETFGHFGRSGTFIWVDPTAKAGCVVLTNEPFGPWAAQAWPPFSDAVLAELDRDGSK